MQQNHCDGVLSNDWNTLLGQPLNEHVKISIQALKVIILLVTNRVCFPQRILELLVEDLIFYKLYLTNFYLDR